MMRAAMILALLAAPAMAQDYVPPAGCEAILTVQGQSCTARHVMRCADNPGGFTVAVVGAPGIVAFTVFDGGSMATRSEDRETGEVFSANPVADPLDVIAAVQTGADSFDMTVTRDSDGLQYRHVGEFHRDGDPVLIGGRQLWPLAGTRTISNPAGDQSVTMHNTMLFDPALRITFGAQAHRADTGVLTQDWTPVTFALPGEPGFLTMEPAYGCAP